MNERPETQRTATTASSPMPAPPHVIRVTGRLVIQRASEVLHELRSALGEHRHVLCDLSGVEAIDEMGLQLLLSTRNTQRLRGRKLSYEHASAPVRALYAAFGMTVENS